MIHFIDHFLNRTTLYKLVLYYLVFLFCIAVIFSFLGILPYNPLNLVISALVIVVVCRITHLLFSHIFEASANIESTYITAFILILIITPPSFHDYLSGFSFLVWASIWAIASKYIFALHKRHIFNPAAFAVALTAFTIHQSASWWISSVSLLPFVVAGGFLIVRKMRRLDLVASFFVVAMVTLFGFNFSTGSNFITMIQTILLYTPLLFFAFVMLTEPLTIPPNKLWRILYGALAGFLFVPSIHIGSLYFTPELALLVVNIFSFLIRLQRR